MVSGTTSAVVWSEPNISQIEAWSSTIYAWCQEFEFEFFFKQKWQKLKN
jgi:protein gp37